MRNIAEKWAKTQNLSIKKYIGKGDYGAAFSTICGKVIKVTSDSAEMFSASLIEGRFNDNIADIYLTDVNEDGMFILLELLDVCYIYELFEELQYESEIQACSIHEIDMDAIKIPCNLSDLSLQLLEDIQSGIKEYKLSGTIPMDIHYDNVGRKINGCFSLFDQVDKNISQNDALLSYYNVKNQL